MHYMDITHIEMIVIRPIVSVHLGLLRINVVRENDTPSLAFKGESHEADAHEELCTAK